MNDEPVRIPDPRMRSCPRCGTALKCIGLTQVSGAESFTIWDAMCPECKWYFETDKPPPDGESQWKEWSAEMPERIRLFNEAVLREYPELADKMRGE
jgi:hypothetical protein